MGGKFVSDSEAFLTSQIITYIGNKRLLLKDIEKEILEIKGSLKKDKLVCADLFSGSGIVSRMLKGHSSKLYANDLEDYSRCLNHCYLSNKSDFPEKDYIYYRNQIEKEMSSGLITGIITENYAPKDTNNIQWGERTFYTHENALLIDTYRNLTSKYVPKELQDFFIAPLLTEASVHVNTSGVFKGFYKDKRTGLGCFGGAGKNALSRILGTVELPYPVLSDHDSEIDIFQKDAVELSSQLKNLDVAYLDPPYNQHPYGSNYFMLNVICRNEIPPVKISRVSGIPSNWNRSTFNKRKLVLDSMKQIVESLDAKYIIISYNSEGFISFDQMTDLLSRFGSVKTTQINYNTFRGSRNLSGRSIHVNEYLFTLKKK